jgi:hypothetical protein
MHRTWSLIKRSIVQALWSYLGHNMAVTTQPAAAAMPFCFMFTCEVLKHTEHALTT